MSFDIVQILNLHPSTQNMEAAYSSETLVSTYKITCYHKPEHHSHTCMREIRNTHKILVGKPEGNRLLGRPTCK
jgi:hypothetical protein